MGPRAGAECLALLIKLVGCLLGPVGARAAGPRCVPRDFAGRRRRTGPHEDWAPGRVGQAEDRAPGPGRFRSTGPHAGAHASHVRASYVRGRIALMLRCRVARGGQVRSRMVVRFSQAYVAMAWRDPRDLPGALVTLLVPTTDGRPASASVPYSVLSGIRQSPPA